MGVLPWSPLAGGWLTGRYRKGKDTPTSRRAQMLPGLYDLSDPANQRKFDAADALAVLADKADVSLIHLALAFVLQHPAVTAPIIGPRTMEHLESQLGAAGVVLSTDVLARSRDRPARRHAIALRRRLPGAGAGGPVPAAPPHHMRFPYKASVTSVPSAARFSVGGSRCSGLRR
jgi:diketogulonate reductase-like aldo/keto reductase